MVANLGEEDGNDPTKQAFWPHWFYGRLLWRSWHDHEDEEVRSLLVANMMGSNKDVNAIDDDLSDRKVLAAHTVYR